MRYVGLNSLRGRRLGAMLLYGVGFIAVWLAVGAAELGAAALLARLGIRGAYSTAFALLVAGAWEFSRVKRLALVRCHRTVALPPVGRRADLACIEFGARRGLSCVISCWALMFVAAVLGSTQLALMAGLTILGIAQGRTLAGWRLLPASGTVLLAGGLLNLIGGQGLG
jgi:predicted metal-binding membrane protein